MKIPANLAGHTLLRLGGVGCQYLFFFLTALLVGRTLGQGALGDFFLAVTILNLLGYTATLGLKQGVIRYAAIYLAQGRPGRVRPLAARAVLFGLLAGLAAAGAIWWGRSWLATVFFSSPCLAEGLVASAAGIPLWAVFTVLVAGLQGLKQIRSKVFLENILQPGTALILAAIAFLLFGPSLSGALWAWVAAVVIALFAAVLSVRRAPALRSAAPAALAPGAFRSILAYSLPLMGVGFLYYVFTRMDILMLGHLRTSAEVGIYGVAARLAMIIPLPLEAFNVGFEPAVAEVGKTDRHRLRRLYCRATPWTLGAGAGLALVLLISAPAAFALFGTNFGAGWPVLAILAAGQMVNLAVGPAGVLLSMTGHSRVVLYNCLGMVLLNLGLNFLLIPPYGAAGAAAATAGALAGINLLRLFEVRALLGIHPFSRRYLKMGLVAGVALAVSILGAQAFRSLEAWWVLVLVFAAVVPAYALVAVRLLLDRVSGGGIINEFFRYNPGP